MAELFRPLPPAASPMFDACLVTASSVIIVGTSLEDSDNDEGSVGFDSTCFNGSGSSASILLGNPQVRQRAWKGWTRQRILVFIKLREKKHSCMCPGHPRLLHRRLRRLLRGLRDHDGANLSELDRLWIQRKRRGSLGLCGKHNERRHVIGGEKGDSISLGSIRNSFQSKPIPPCLPVYLFSSSAAK